MFVYGKYRMYGKYGNYKYETLVWNPSMDILINSSLYRVVL